MISLIEKIEQFSPDTKNRLDYILEKLSSANIITDLQAYFHTLFKRINQYYENDFIFESSHPAMSDFLKNYRFNMFLEKIHFYDIETIRLIDKSANIYKHSKFIKIENNQLYIYVKCLWNLTDSLLSYVYSDYEPTPFSEDLINTLIHEYFGNKDNSTKHSTNHDSLEKLAQELNKEKNELEKKNSTLEEQVKELSNLISNQENTTLHFMGIKKVEGAQFNFYDEAIKEKRNGNLREAIKIYKQQILAHNYIDDIIFKSLEKVAFLNSDYELSSLCNIVVMHITLNKSKRIFEKSNDKMTKQEVDWFIQTTGLLDSLQMFRTKFMDNELDKYLTGCLMANETIFRFYLSQAMLNNSQIDQEVLNGYKQSIQHGQFSNPIQGYKYKSFIKRFLNSYELYDVFIEMLDQIRIEDIENLAILSLYPVKSSLNKY